MSWEEGKDPWGPTSCHVRFIQSHKAKPCDACEALPDLAHDLSNLISCLSPTPALCHLAGAQTPGASVLPLGLCTCSSLLSCLDTDTDVDVDVDVSIGIGVGVCTLPTPPSSLCSVDTFSLRFPLTTWFLPKACSLLPLPPPPGAPNSSSRFTSRHSIYHYLIRACVFMMCLSQLPAERELHENWLVCTLRLSCPARGLAKSGFSISFC